MAKVFFADGDGAKWTEIDDQPTGGYLWLNRRDGLSCNVHLNSGGADVFIS